MEEVEFLVVGCGPAGGTAAREAARSGVETLVLERDAVVGAKRVCAAGLRPGFFQIFDLPRSIVHCDTPLLALHDSNGRRFEVPIPVGHTTTREELDGAIASTARADGAEIRTSALFRSFTREEKATIVEYADLASGQRHRVRARHVFLAQGSSARIDASTALGYGGWDAGLITCYQYRVYLERPVAAAAYQTLEMHYYVGRKGRGVVAWVFPKRDHLSIGLGIPAKVPGTELRAELDAFLATARARLFPDTAYTVREEGNLLYGGAPRPRLSDGNVAIGGTAAGLVDATTGEGLYEAAISGRFAAEAMVRARRDSHAVPARIYERLTKDALYARLRRRHKLMGFLERRPARFGLLFERIASSPQLAALLQRERDDFSFGERVYLSTQGLCFGLRAMLEGNAVARG